MSPGCGRRLHANGTVFVPDLLRYSEAGQTYQRVDDEAVVHKAASGVIMRMKTTQLSRLHREPGERSTNNTSRCLPCCIPCIMCTRAISSLLRNDTALRTFTYMDNMCTLDRILQTVPGRAVNIYGRVVIGRKTYPRILSSMTTISYKVQPPFILHSEPNPSQISAHR